MGFRLETIDETGQFIVPMPTDAETRQKLQPFHPWIRYVPRSLCMVRAWTDAPFPTLFSALSHERPSILHLSIIFVWSFGCKSTSDAFLYRNTSINSSIPKGSPSLGASIKGLSFNVLTLPTQLPFFFPFFQLSSHL
ncbi:hypothetical protein CC2G_015302 [Coprinopsis cinerea AmutBmut pab1-1]|nr:hypothetical protein CC2G_015302 [Coprinopsis cinerea AmutBmut pab1-1]